MELLLYSLRSMGFALLQNYKHALSSMYKHVDNEK